MPKTVAASHTAGRVLMTYSFGNKLARITRMEELPDGPTYAATMTTGEACTLALLGGTATSLFLMFGADEDYRFGRAPSQPGGGIAWQSDWRTDVTGSGPQRFIFDSGMGVASGTGPRVILDATGATTDLSGGDDRVVGDGDQVIWSAGYSHSINSYTVATGQVELVALGDRGALGVAVTDQRIVWISASRSNDQYVDLTWHWSSRGRMPAQMSVHNGPVLSRVGPLTEDMKAGGDWAAATHCPDPDDAQKCQVIAWNMATNETFAVTSRPGRVFWNVLAVTAKEIYLGEYVLSAAGLTTLDEIVRIETQALPMLAAGGGWPQ